MAHRSQCSNPGDNPLDPNYLPPHYREEYRLAIDALIEENLEGYYKFLQTADVVDFLATPEIQYIQSSVQVPQQSLHPEQQFLDTGADGSSDTYWPIHSDLDVPGLDLGWPQMHHFIEPTEVTTLINPPEGDMPNIKEQARRLIKNARQVIAIVMDMFSDVDIFADILNAAMRNVAVYILLDEQNAEYFVNMVTNCRVNLQSIQFLRVRTVSGNQYKCRSGKSFKGQMMDRFLLTDCRAVLSGNYSFMWSFEKLHRCMAHLFLGQLVSTFDEEFRVLYAQSQPLIIENVLAQMEDLNPAPKRQYPSDRTALYREPRKFRDTGFQEERLRHSYDERTDVDWRLMPLKSQDPLHGPSDIYSRFPSQQPRMDPSLDQGPGRLPMLENPAFKRHSYAEGASDRFSYPFLHQQGAPEPENQGRLFHRGQQPYPGPGRGPETDYSSYDKFWNQDFHNADQYSESGLPPDLISSDTFDPVLNYLSSTRNVDFDQSSDKLLPTVDLPYSSPQPRRHSFGQPYVNQTSPTPSNPGDQKQLFQEPNIDRKDPTVKQGLRNWRISSFLSAHDNPTDEGLPQGPHQGPDSFEEPFNPLQQTGTGIDLSVPKIPNVREFKIPATPRASQIPSYTKALVREQPKKLPDETTEVAAEVKTTPTPSESSSTTDVEKVEEAEQKEPKVSLRFRDDSFRRKYNAAAPRSSRLRSSLIFSSLDQHAPPDKTASGQQDEESDKNDAEQTKGSQGLGQRRPLAREWSRYIKSASFNTSLTDASKPNEGDSKADVKDQPKVEVSKDQQPLKQSDAEQADPSLSMAQSKPPEAELPKTDQPVQAPKPLLTTSAFVDMNDPETRLIFFKELAAKRKAAKAAEADKSKDKAPVKPLPDLKNNTTVKKEEPDPKEDSEKAVSASPSEASSEKNQTTDDAGKTASTEACKSVSVPLEISDNTDKSGSLVKNDTSTTQSCREEQTSMSTDSEKIELKNSQPETSLRVSTDTESLSNPPEDLSKPAEKESSLNHPPTPTNATPANIASPVKGTDESENSSCESTSKESSTLTPSPVEEQPSAALDSSPVQFESTIAEPPPLSEQQTESDLSLSYPSIKNSDHVLSDSHVSPSPATSSPAPVSTPGKTLSSDVTPEESNSVPSSNILSPISNETEAQESVSSSQTEMTSEADAAHVESNIPPDMCASSAEPDTSSLQSTTNTNLEESCAPTPLETDGLKSDKNSVAEQSEVPDSSVDVKADTTPPPLSPSSTKVDSPVLSDLKTSSKPDQIETVTTPSSPEHSSSETHLPVSEDSTSNTSQPATDAPPQHAPTQTTPPSELNLTGSVIPTPVETVPRSSPLTESVGSSLCPEAEKTGTNSSTLRIPSDALEQITTDPSETPELPSTETSTPTEPTSKVPTEPTPEPVSSESQLSESTVPAENSKIDNQSEESKEPELSGPDEKTTEDAEATKNVCNSTKAESVISEKTNDLVSQNKSSETSEITSDEVVPLSPQSKQPKSIQSRYHASTANVLSSSNLRDDTKLLLEQISANSQSRNETNKEAPVTDDEKEDEADKNAKREKEREIRTINRGQPKTTEEREKLLERIQSMRKERKVYSRFEMAP